MCDETATRRAADWLVSTQDEDGCWRTHSTPFAIPGEKAYETHTAWGLLEAERILPNSGYGAAAMKNIRWALGCQRGNGWFDNCCLTDFSRPPTHTIGYTLRGILEGHMSYPHDDLLNAAVLTANALLDGMDDTGFLPGYFSADWSTDAKWACLTGTAQSSMCWLLLFRLTQEVRYRDAAITANEFVRRTVKLTGPDHVRGAVKGSFPVDRAYGQYQYLNWAAKFLIDALLAERALISR